MKPVRLAVAVLALAVGSVVASASPALACHGSEIEIWIDDDTCIGLLKLEDIELEG